MIATHIVGLVLGLCLVSVVRAPQDLRKHLVLATTVGE
jgi:hypothetical protein